MDIHKLFDQQQEIDARGWELFSTDYDRKNPPPEKTENKWQQRGLIAGLVCAMFVSGIFTVQAFHDVFNLAGVDFFWSRGGSIAAFVMIDFILFFITTFYLTTTYTPRKLAEGSDMKAVQYVAIFIGAFTFLVSVASNEYFMLIGFRIMERGSEAMRGIGLSVGILLGLAPPIQSVAVGTIVAIAPLRAQVEYQEWLAKKERSWRSARSKYDLKIDERIERLARLSPGVHEIHEKSHEKPVQKKRRVNIQEIARQVYENGDSELGTEQMMERYGISAGSTTRIREILSKNGHAQ